MSESFNDALARLSSSMASVAEKQPRFRGCLWGPSGTGKTVLAAKIMQQIIAPKMGILYIDTSEGWVSLRNHENEGLTKNTLHIPFTTIEDIRVIGTAIKNKVGKFAYIGGIILDEASSMAQMDTDRLFEVRKQTTAGTRNATDSLVPEWPDYHAALARFRTMNAELFDIEGLHVIMTAHQAEKKGRDGSVINLFPSFSPKIAAKVKEPLHLVGFCTSQYRPEGDNVGYFREVQVHPTGLVDAKCRLPINTLRVPSEHLPVIIHDWLGAGGVEVQHDDTPIEDPDETKSVEGLTPEEALVKVDEATEGGALSGPEPVESDGESEEFSIFAPIN